MFHIGQVVTNVASNEKVIYGGIDMKRASKGLKATLFLTPEPEWGSLCSKEGKPLYEPVKEGKNLVVGEFCLRRGLLGYFFGVLELGKLTDDDLELIVKTVKG